MWERWHWLSLVNIFEWTIFLIHGRNWRTIHWISEHKYIFYNISNWWRTSRGQMCSFHHLYDWNVHTILVVSSDIVSSLSIAYATIYTSIATYVTQKWSVMFQSRIPSGLYFWSNQISDKRIVPTVSHFLTVFVYCKLYWTICQADLGLWRSDFKALISTLTTQMKRPRVLQHQSTKHELLAF